MARIFLIIALLCSFYLEAAELPQGFSRIAKQCGSNPKALYAIALTESETALTNGKSSVWPHSINWQGKTFLFQTRKEMYFFAEDLISKGYRSFDVGMMQVNWRWHSHRVNSLWELTDIKTNIRVACDILVEGYKAKGDWTLAAGFYHSPNNKTHSTNYINRYKSKLGRVKLKGVSN